MQPKSDARLLRDYAEHGADTAFAELVQRHTNLVYSAALRQVENPSVASDIAQNVFIGLARGARSLAPKLSPEASIAGWLCRSARNLSLNHRRDEFRRLTRERHAMDQLAPIPNDTPDWDQLRHVLDDAMSELSDKDYDAILLRFFKNQDFHAVGAAIGTSDDTAQKRVARALEKLRDLLSQRGVRTTGAALTAVISANAIQAAPAGLSIAISTAAASTAAITSVATATKTIAMTTLQKTMVAAAITGMAGLTVYEAIQARSFREQFSELQKATEPLRLQVERLMAENERSIGMMASLKQELDQARQNQSELLRLRGQVSRFKADSEELAMLKSEAGSELGLQEAVRWQRRVALLKERLQAQPGASIPELSLLSEKDWLKAAYSPLDSADDYRAALSSLRNLAEGQVTPVFQKAWQEYLTSNPGKPLTSIDQLMPYLTLDEAIVSRWELAPAEKVTSIKGDSKMIITQKTYIDDILDVRQVVGPNSFGATGFLPDEVYAHVGKAFEAYKAANNNRAPADYSELLPYAASAKERESIQKIVVKNTLGNRRY